MKKNTQEITINRPVYMLDTTCRGHMYDKRGVNGVTRNDLPVSSIIASTFSTAQVRWTFVKGSNNGTCALIRPSKNEPLEKEFADFCDKVEGAVRFDLLEVPPSIWPKKKDNSEIIPTCPNPCGKKIRRGQFKGLRRATLLDKNGICPICSKH